MLLCSALDISALKCLITVSPYLFQEALRRRGLKDDTTCIVVDILPPNHSLQPSPSPKKQNKLKSFLFRRRCGANGHRLSKKLSSVGIVEELFEEGSAMLAERLVMNLLSDPLCIFNP